MSSKTKIVVLRMKEIIYTAIFIGLGIILITLFFIMFRPKEESSAVSSSQAEAGTVSYTPGIYRTSLVLGSQTVDLEVAVDSDHINSIALSPLSDSVEPCTLSWLRHWNSSQNRSALPSPWKTLHTRRGHSIPRLP